MRKPTTTTTTNSTVNTPPSSEMVEPISISPTSLVQQELLAMAECPVCFEYVLPPILQCRNGHIACAQCRPRCPTCPSCRDSEFLWGSRNLSLERIVHMIPFPCKYAELGCQRTLDWREKLQHERECPCRPFTCPCPGPPCHWTGLSPNDVVRHLESSDHPSVTSLAGEEIVFLATEVILDGPGPHQRTGQVNWVMMQRCFDHDFILILQKQKIGNHQHNPRYHFYCIVQVISRSGSQERFTYRLELVSCTDHTRRILFQSICRNIVDGGGIQGAIVDGDCMVFNEFVVRKFACPQTSTTCIHGNINSSTDNLRPSSPHLTGLSAPSFNLPINVTIKRVQNTGDSTFEN
ncbi:hypothetical protein ACOME3_006702 [Neoechinorhynchus agilis]